MDVKWLLNTSFKHSDCGPEGPERPWRVEWEVFCGLIEDDSYRIKYLKCLVLICCNSLGRIRWCSFNVGVMCLWGVRFGVLKAHTMSSLASFSLCLQLVDKMQTHSKCFSLLLAILPSALLYAMMIIDSMSETSQLIVSFY